MDQYVAAHPEYVLERPQESAVIDPDNLIIFVNHLKCAAFELPFDEGDDFGGNPVTSDVLEYLAREARILHKAGGRYHWMAEAYPAEDIGLSSADVDYFVVIDEDRNVVMAQVDRPDAMTQIHEGAIYGHQGEQFLITRLEYDDRRAYAKRINPDYFTEAEVDVDVRVVHVDDRTPGRGYDLHRGEVGVKTLATVYKKIKFYTRENVGAGEIALPPEEMETTSVWMLLDKETTLRVGLTDPRTRRRLVRHWRTCCVHLLPVYLGCSVTDVRGKAEIKSAEFDTPSMFLFDNTPGGVGLAEKVYALWPTLLNTAREVISRCACTSGCPGVRRPGAAHRYLGQRRREAYPRRVLWPLVTYRTRPSLGHLCPVLLKHP